MKLKSLLFGSAAGLMVVTGAQAADLPAAEDDPEPNNLDLKDNDEGQ